MVRKKRKEKVSEIYRVKEIRVVRTYFTEDVYHEESVTEGNIKRNRKREIFRITDQREINQSGLGPPKSFLAHLLIHYPYHVTNCSITVGNSFQNHQYLQKHLYFPYLIFRQETLSIQCV